MSVFPLSDVRQPLKQAPYTWGVAIHFTGEVWIQNFRMTHSSFDELHIAVEPLVAPAASFPSEPVPTDKRIVCPVNAQKVRTMPFSNRHLI